MSDKPDPTSFTYKVTATRSAPGKVKRSCGRQRWFYWTISGEGLPQTYVPSNGEICRELCERRPGLRLTSPEVAVLRAEGKLLVVRVEGGR